ncbi:hypothetical protein Tco_0120773 [Tanacetum coccineum]
METLPTYCLKALYILVVHCPGPYQWNKNVLVDTKVIDTTHSIDLNMPYGSVEGQYVVLSLQNTQYCLEEQDTLFRLQKSIGCGRRFDTSYPTGGYAVSGGLP